MCSRYSSSVVAPTMRSSPRASIGLIMLPASMAESPLAPAPTMVCSSSMKVTISPSASVISWSTALSRSSNSPRYLAPATIELEVQRHQPLALEALRDVAGDDPLGQALDDRGLADAGLADEDRVVLGAAGQHLDDAADLGVPADDRVDLALAGALGEVDGVLLQRLVGALGVGRGDLAVAADGAEGGQQGVAGGAGAASGPCPPRRREPARPTSRCSVETNSSPRAPACSPAALITRSSSRDGDGAGTVAPLTLGRRRSAASVLVADVGRVGAHRLQQRAGDPVGLLEQGGEQVQGLQRGLAAADREPLGGGEGFLRTGRELALHGAGSASFRWSGAVVGDVVDRPTTRRLSLFRSTSLSPPPAGRRRPTRANCGHTRVARIAAGPRLAP